MSDLGGGEIGAGADVDQTPLGGGFGGSDTDPYATDQPGPNDLYGTDGFPVRDGGPDLLPGPDLLASATNPWDLVRNLFNRPRSASQEMRGMDYLPPDGRTSDALAAGSNGTSAVTDATAAAMPGADGTAPPQPMPDGTADTTHESARPSQAVVPHRYDSTTGTTDPTGDTAGSADGNGGADHTQARTSPFGPDGVPDGVNFIPDNEPRPASFRGNDRTWEKFKAYYNVHVRLQQEGAGGEKPPMSDFRGFGPPEGSSDYDYDPTDIRVPPDQEEVGQNRKDMGLPLFVRVTLELASGEGSKATGEGQGDQEADKKPVAAASQVDPFINYRNENAADTDKNTGKGDKTSEGDQPTPEPEPQLPLEPESEEERKKSTAKTDGDSVETVDPRPIGTLRPPEIDKPDASKEETEEPAAEQPEEPPKTAPKPDTDEPTDADLPSGDTTVTDLPDDEADATSSTDIDTVEPPPRHVELIDTSLPSAVGEGTASQPDTTATPPPEQPVLPLPPLPVATEKEDDSTTAVVKKEDDTAGTGAPADEEVLLYGQVVRPTEAADAKSQTNSQTKELQTADMDTSVDGADSATTAATATGADTTGDAATETKAGTAVDTRNNTAVAPDDSGADSRSAAAIPVEVTRTEGGIEKTESSGAGSSPGPHGSNEEGPPAATSPSGNEPVPVAASNAAPSTSAAEPVPAAQPTVNTEPANADPNASEPGTADPNTSASGDPNTASNNDPDPGGSDPNSDPTTGDPTGGSTTTDPQTAQGNAGANGDPNAANNNDPQGPQNNSDPASGNSGGQKGSNNPNTTANTGNSNTSNNDPNSSNTDPNNNPRTAKPTAANSPDASADATKDNSAPDNPSVIDGTVTSVKDLGPDEKADADARPDAPDAAARPRPPRPAQDRRAQARREALRRARAARRARAKAIHAIQEEDPDRYERIIAGLKREKIADHLRKIEEREKTETPRGIRVTLGVARVVVTAGVRTVGGLTNNVTVKLKEPGNRPGFYTAIYTDPKSGQTIEKRVFGVNRATAMLHAYGRSMTAAGKLLAQRM